MGRVVNETATSGNTQSSHAASVFKLARGRDLSPNKLTEGGKPGEEVLQLHGLPASPQPP